MTKEFKLAGLSKPKSFTLLTEDEQVFWATSDMTHEKFIELWNYAHEHWADEKIALVECDSIKEDGTPINPKVLNVYEQ